MAAVLFAVSFFALVSTALNQDKKRMPLPSLTRLNLSGLCVNSTKAISIIAA
jgi:hypothetical protein